MVLLVDTNIILDVLLSRPEFVKDSSMIWKLIIPGISEPPARTLRATVPENERHIFR